jgi:hypothetical protein
MPNTERVVDACMVAVNLAMDGHGTSINYLREHPEKGYMVAVSTIATFDSIEKILPYTVCINAPWLLGHRQYIGSWIDTETGRVYFDVSINIMDKSWAIASALNFNQKAIYDVENDKTIYIN